jgi:hypothetical protein
VTILLHCDCSGGSDEEEQGQGRRRQDQLPGAHSMNLLLFLLLLAASQKEKIGPAAGPYLSVHEKVNKNLRFVRTVLGHTFIP